MMNGSKPSVSSDEGQTPWSKRSCGEQIGRLSMIRWKPRQVLECASLLALWQWRPANRKRQRTGAVQDATARSAGAADGAIGKPAVASPRRLRLIEVGRQSRRRE